MVAIRLEPYRKVRGVHWAARHYRHVALWARVYSMYSVVWFFLERKFCN